MTLRQHKKLMVKSLMGLWFFFLVKSYYLSFIRTKRFKKRAQKTHTHYNMR